MKKFLVASKLPLDLSEFEKVWGLEFEFVDKLEPEYPRWDIQVSCIVDGKERARIQFSEAFSPDAFNDWLKVFAKI